jgi:hypothetical protein
VVERAARNHRMRIFFAAVRPGGALEAYLMSHPKEKLVAERIIPIISDAFNRSMSALEAAGAIDRKELNQHYTGKGSKYYDIVTEQIELTAGLSAAHICELFTQTDKASDTPLSF